MVEADAGTGRAARDVLAAAGVHGDLLDLYRHIAAVSLPDVGNGYFIDPAEDVADPSGTGRPTELTGAATDTITVFGSDGGGGLFAVNSSGAVYRLHGGSLLGSVYEVEDSGVEVIAPDLWGFLQHLRDRVAEEAGAGRP